MSIVWCLLEGSAYLRSSGYYRKYGNQLNILYCIKILNFHIIYLYNGQLKDYHDYNEC